MNTPLYMLPAFGECTWPHFTGVQAPSDYTQYLRLYKFMIFWFLLSHFKSKPTRCICPRGISWVSFNLTLWVYKYPLTLTGLVLCLIDKQFYSGFFGFVFYFFNEFIIVPVSEDELVFFGGFDLAFLMEQDQGAGLVFDTKVYESSAVNV